MSARRFAPATLLALAGCRFMVTGETGRYRGEYSPWIPHMSMFGLILLIGDVWACVHIWKKRGRSLVAKLLWTLLVWLFPLGGLILFFLFGWEG